MSGARIYIAHDLRDEYEFRINELVDAIEEHCAPFLSDEQQKDLICHRGITTVEKCGRCSRERRVRDAIKELRNER